MWKSLAYKEFSKKNKSRIVEEFLRIWKSKYEKVPIYIGDDAGYLLFTTDEHLAEIGAEDFTDDKTTFVLSINAKGYLDADFNKVIRISPLNAYSGKYKGVVGEFIDSLFKLANTHMPNATKSELFVFDDVSDLYWEKLARRLKVFYKQ